MFGSYPLGLVYTIFVALPYRPIPIIRMSNGPIFTANGLGIPSHRRLVCLLLGHAPENHQ